MMPAFDAGWKKMMTKMLKHFNSSMERAKKLEPWELDASKVNISLFDCDDTKITKHLTN